MEDVEKEETENQPSLGASIVYIAIVAVLCLVPSVGLLFGGGEVSSDSDAAPAPKLIADDGSLNVNVMADAGDWFDDHFAFRNEWVTAAAKVESLFGVSPNSHVALGTNGWLYYGDSVDDYRGTNQLSDRALYDIAHSMKLIQTYALAHGVDFAFVISPNKNTLYGENMPYYYQVKVGDTNLDRIVAVLESEGVNYVDARALFEEQDGVLYRERDSHWNNKGAALVADAVMTALDHAHRDYSDEPYAERADAKGDLDKMIYPVAATPEIEFYYDNGPVFDYVTEGIETNFEPRIETKSSADGATGSLVVYRDSFCNSMLPFFAEAYGKAYFSRGIPYQVSADIEAYGADTLVIERAQRFMRDMAATAPIMPAPMVLDESVASGEFTFLENVETEEQGEYLIVKGLLPVGDSGSADVSVGDRIAIRLNGNLVYEAFGTCDAETGQEGFQLMVPLSIVTGDDVFELSIW